MAKNVLFPCPQRVRRGAAVPRIGGPRGNPKSVKKTLWKTGAQKEVPKTLLVGGPMGSLRELPGAPMKPKWEPKGSKNGAQNDIV